MKATALNWFSYKLFFSDHVTLAEVMFVWHANNQRVMRWVGGIFSLYYWYCNILYTCNVTRVFSVGVARLLRDFKAKYACV